MALVCENVMGRISELSCYSYRATINIPYPWHMGIPLASPRGIGLGAKGFQRIVSPAGLFWTHQSMSLIIVIRWVLTRYLHEALKRLYEQPPFAEPGCPLADLFPVRS